jgi:hypothetical protein
MPHQERALVESLAPDLTGDLVVAPADVQERHAGTKLASGYRAPRDSAGTQSLGRDVREATGWSQPVSGTD